MNKNLKLALIYISVLMILIIGCIGFEMFYNESIIIKKLAGLTILQVILQPATEFYKEKLKILFDYEQ